MVKLQHRSIYDNQTLIDIDLVQTYLLQPPKPRKSRTKQFPPPFPYFEFRQPLPASLALCRHEKEKRYPCGFVLGWKCVPYFLVVLCLGVARKMPYIHYQSICNKIVFHLLKRKKYRLFF